MKISFSYFAPLRNAVCLIAVFAATAAGWSQTQAAPGEPPAKADVPPATAQTPPQFVVRGTVKSGKTPLPGAAVTAANTLTGKKVAAATAIDGSFTLTLPSRGRYVVKVEQAAFAPTTKEVVITPEAPQSTVDADLMLASRAQILAAQQQPTGGALQQQIATALANRGMQSLAVTESDSSETAGSGGSSDTLQAASALPLNGAGTDTPTESVSITGAMGQAQNFGMNPDEIQDRIQEFRDRMQREGTPGGGDGGPFIFGSGGPGGGGGFGGGQGVFTLGGRMGRLNINQPHGGIFYSTDNSIFDAAPYALNNRTDGLGGPQQKPEYDQNRFGVTLGSPLHIPHVVRDDKTFVFLNWTSPLNWWTPAAVSQFRAM